MNDAMTIRLIGLISIFFSVASLEAQTQAEINATARADFAKADVDLNKTYQAVLVKLPPNEKQKLKDAQRAWVARAMQKRRVRRRRPKAARWLRRSVTRRWRT